MNNNVNSKIIIPAGSKLYHDTIEEFDIKNSKVGGYDKIFWTSEYPEISSTYIPVAGGTIFLYTKILSNPSLNENIQDLQKQLGIEYSDIKGEFNQINSFKIAPIFAEINNNYNNKLKQFIKLRKTYNYIKEKEKKLTKDKLKSLYKIKQKLDKLDEDLNNINVEKIQNNYVNSKLTELGYKPKRKDTYNDNFFWELKVAHKNNKEEILPADFREQGRLLTIIPQKNLKIFDLTKNGQIEGDLMNPDYHKLNLFKTIEKNKYDGIKINDYAQIEGIGNYGHHSIGLFQNTLKYVKITEQPAEHPKDFWKNYVASNF